MEDIMPLYMPVKAMTFAAVVLFAPSAGTTIVADWNAAALQEVRLSPALRNGPPMVARALAIAHTCMYDAWAAYDGDAVATTDRYGKRRRPADERTDPNKAQAISFAAYRCLLNLFPDQDSASRLQAVMDSHQYDYTDTSNNKTTPTGIGNIAAQAVIDARANDGSNQYGNAPCPPENVCPLPPVHLRVLAQVPCVIDPYPWTTVPLQHLLDAPPELQPLPCVGPDGTPSGPYADYDDVGYSHYVPSNPLMGYCTSLVTGSCPGGYRDGNPDPFINPALPWPDVVDPNRWQPLVYNNHKRQTFLGAHWKNVTPFALTSAEQFDDIVPPPDVQKNLGQYQQNVDEVLQFSADLDATSKLNVEYWADGPASELPPGHWGLFAQFVSERDNHSIDQDVKMFFAMHNASFDAGIVAWHIKRKYDGVRPITAIRYLKQGQMVRAWGGPGRPTEDIPGEKWTPYNPGSNLTPGFPGYISGHSIFSSASATVLRLFTGSDTFGFWTDIPPDFGRVEPGIPAVETRLSFATFSEAAQQAGLSRIQGGIHFFDDMTVGQDLGVLIGQQAWDKAQTYFNGTAQ
jgi:hypothetical protein